MSRNDKCIALGIIAVLLVLMAVIMYGCNHIHESKENFLKENDNHVEVLYFVQGNVIVEGVVTKRRMAFNILLNGNIPSAGEVWNVHTHGGQVLHFVKRVD